MSLGVYDLPLCAARASIELEHRMNGPPADLPATLALANYLDARLPKDLRVVFALRRSLRIAGYIARIGSPTADELDAKIAFITQELLFLSQRGFKVNTHEIGELQGFVLAFSDEMSTALRRIRHR